MGVYSGILPITKDEAGLATVIGHEVAHAAAHHGAERMSEELVINTGGQIVGSAISKYDAKTQAAATTVYGLGSQLGRALPHSRKQESEADEMGLIYRARAGFNHATVVGEGAVHGNRGRALPSSTEWLRLSARAGKSIRAFAQFDQFRNRHPEDSVRSS